MAESRYFDPSAWSLVPGCTVHVVIDDQNDFLHPDGWYATHSINIEHMRRVIEPTRMLNAAHKKALEDLRGKSGKEFDAAYAAQMVKDHNEAVALFTAASSLPDSELAGFASKTLPTLRDHQAMAKQLPAH